LSIEPEASVVIVAYNTDDTLFTRNLDALFHDEANKKESFEVIVVDNSDRKSDKKDVSGISKRFPVQYISMNGNYGLSVGRNVGIRKSRGRIVIFLDDDAVPGEGFIAEHIRAFRDYDIVGLRGRCFGRTRSIYNHLAVNYDLGDKFFPHYINLEGNSSFTREVLEEVGGFYEEIKGAGGFEGVQLSFRIIEKVKDPGKLIYYPCAVIYHDNCGSFLKYFRKRLRHRRYESILQEQFPGLVEFMGSYQLPLVEKEQQSLWVRFRLKIIRFMIKIGMKVYR